VDGRFRREPMRLASRSAAGSGRSVFPSWAATSVLRWAVQRR